MLHDLFGVLFPKMHINLCGVQICMSKPLLELERRDAFFRLVGGEGMPESVTTCPFGNASVFSIFHDELSDASLRNGLILVI